MVLDLVILSGDDGFSAEILSIKGCESWAHTEDEVIEKIVELVRFYLKLGPAHIIEIDFGRRSKNKKVLKLLIRKE
ncbi:MAG: hypothetical protein AB9882_04670 [Ignavibacteriaceae bacterium]